MLSGLSYAEMSSRIPSGGSSYSYTYFAIGECAAMMAGWGLTFEYGLSSSAVARSWGDKMALWLNQVCHVDTSWNEPFNGASVLGAMIHLASVAVVLGGRHIGKKTINFFTIVKLLMIAFMAIAGEAACKSV